VPLQSLTSVLHKFSLENELIQVYVNEVEITSSVTPSTSFADYITAKTVTFTEPATASAFVIKGKENNEMTNAILTLRCSSTTPGSLWNFATTSNSGWSTVVSLTRTEDVMPNGWSNNFYSGTQTIPTVVNVTSSLSSSCGSLPTQHLRVNQGANTNYYFALRRFVNGTSCGTNSPTMPTLLPTRIPTKSPVTGKPTSSPRTSKPSKSPTTVRPSKSPSTAKPSRSPTKRV
jgi:hypothetical protein